MECGDGMSDKRNTERKKGTEEEKKRVEHGRAHFDRHPPIGSRQLKVKQLASPVQGSGVGGGLFSY